MKECLVLFAIAVFVTTGYAGTCNSYEREKVNEGYYKCVYKDPLGIPTIGVGFNLKKSGARHMIMGVGANYDAILMNKECLSDSQIMILFHRDMATAIKCASRWLGMNWYYLSADAQSAVADMAFNMGCSKLRRFVKMHAALSQYPPNYKSARKEMRSSLWCHQVGKRCNRNQRCMH